MLPGAVGADIGKQVRTAPSKTADGIPPHNSETVIVHIAVLVLGMVLMLRLNRSLWPFGHSYLQGSGDKDPVPP